MINALDLNHTLLTLKLLFVNLVESRGVSVNHGIDAQTIAAIDDLKDVTEIELLATGAELVGLNRH